MTSQSPFRNLDPMLIYLTQNLRLCSCCLDFIPRRQHMCRHWNKKPLCISCSRVTELSLRVAVRQFEIVYPKLACANMYRERFLNIKGMQYFFLNQY